jgi:hypothetical protein
MRFSSYEKWAAGVKRGIQECELVAIFTYFTGPRSPACVRRSAGFDEVRCVYFVTRMLIRFLSYDEIRYVPSLA